jgi:predicted O-linked N-acetylglucosamine transferase (SPINDLY family)
MKPPSQQKRIEQARALHRAGSLGRAEAIYRELLAEDGGCAPALHGLGLIALAAGDLPHAERLLQAALSREPGSAELRIDLTAVLRAAGAMDEACRHAAAAVELAPEMQLAWSAFGNCLAARGEFTEAIEALRIALQIEPRNPSVLNDLGVALGAAANHHAALNLFQQSARLQPQAARTWHNLASTYQAIGELQQALDCVDRALQLQPAMVVALRLQARIANDAGRPQLAQQALQRLLQQSPGDLIALSELADLRARLGMQRDAIELFRQAASLAPRDPVIQANRLVAENYDPETTPAQLLQLHRQWAQECLARKEPEAVPRASTVIPKNVRDIGDLQTTPVTQAPPVQGLPVTRRDPAEFPRIGYVSADLREHPVGWLLIADFESLAKRGVWQSVYSNHAVVDPLTQRFRAAASAWHDVLGMPDDGAANRIAADGIDLLIDLSGLTRGNRLALFARRAAPVQLSWLGYPCTTGIPSIGFLLADSRHVPPEHEVWFQERVWRMPHCYSTFEPPVDAPEVNRLPSRNGACLRIACFHNPCKLNPAWLAAVAQVGAEIPAAVFHFKYSGYEHTPTQELVRNALAALGVDHSRLIFEGGGRRSDMLRAYLANDFALDTFPYSGGITTCESLWMGLPVVTCPGPTMASRHAFAYLSTIGCHETIAASRQEFVEIAVRLAGQREWLESRRQALRTMMLASPLCDYGRHADDLLLALGGMADCAAAIDLSSNPGP